MAAPMQHPRFALQPDRAERSLPAGAWWPESRQLSDQLAELFALWPEERGRIQRVLYSPPDWDDHPRKIAVGSRLVKAGSFPNDDTHEIVLSVGNGERRRIIVIPPATSPVDADRLLAAALVTPRA